MPYTSDELDAAIEASIKLYERGDPNFERPSSSLRVRTGIGLGLVTYGRKCLAFCLGH